jgi:hypothetical protein
MAEEYEPSLAGILLALRQMLVDTQRANDKKEASALLTTFALLLEASYLTPNRRLSALLEDLESSARDFAGGMYGKATIPTAQQITEAVRSLPPPP